MKKFSIIVPVYQVEKYIRACVESIFRQGLDDDVFEVIIVNDGSTDHSMQQIADLIGQHSNIIVLEQENQGLSMARNNGMKNANGDYIIFLDSDDLLADNCLKQLMEMTLEQQPDLIMADFEKKDDEAILRYRQQSSAAGGCKTTAKSGKALFMEDLNPRECYVWRTVYRRAFLEENHIRYVPGITYEDTPFTHECYLKATHCLRTNLFLYIYRVGHASITTGMTKKKGMDFSIALAKTWEMTRMEGIDLDVRKQLKDNVFAVFSVLIYAITNEVKDGNERMQVVRHLQQMVPDLNFNHSMKQRCITFLYKRMPGIYIDMKVLFYKLAKRLR